MITQTGSSPTGNTENLDNYLVNSGTPGSLNPGSVAAIQHRAHHAGDRPFHHGPRRDAGSSGPTQDLGYLAHEIVIDLGRINHEQASAPRGKRGLLPPGSGLGSGDAGG